MVSNLVPEPMAELTQLFRGLGGGKGAAASYLPLMQALFSQVNPIPIKAAMAALGLTAACFGHPSGKWTKDLGGELMETLRAFDLLSE